MQLARLMTVEYPWDWRSIDDYEVALRVAPGRRLDQLVKLNRLQRLSLPRRSIDELPISWPINLTDLDLSELRGEAINHYHLPPTIKRLTLDRSEASLDLASIPLEELSVNECPRVVSWPSTLTALSLDWALIGGQLLCRLPPTLRRLHVACQTCLTDDHLSRLGALVELKCPHCPDITNDGLRVLTRLKYLDCTDCPMVTNEGLKPLQRLRVLICADCPRISVDVVEYLPVLRRFGYGGQVYRHRALRNHRYLAGIEHRAPVKYHRLIQSTSNWSFNAIGRDARLTLLVGILFIWYLVTIYSTSGQMIEPLYEFQF